MGTGVATQRIKSGQRIRVDGDRGMVILVDEVDEQEVERIQVQQLAEERAKSQKRKLIFALSVGSAILAIWWKKRRKR
jgi:phosphoenolpyruvate-protein kinase (PTS system EI component)